MKKYEALLLFYDGVDSACQRRMSFAMLVGFVLGVIAAFSGSAIVCSYILLADVRDRD